MGKGGQWCIYRSDLSEAGVKMYEFLVTFSQKMTGLVLLALQREQIFLISKKCVKFLLKSENLTKLQALKPHCQNVQDWTGLETAVNCRSHSLLGGKAGLGLEMERGGVCVCDLSPFLISIVRKGLFRKGLLLRCFQGFSHFNSSKKPTKKTNTVVCGLKLDSFTFSSHFSR